MDSLSRRVAKGHRRLEANVFFRLLGGRGAATVLLGTALSIGGISEAMSGAHFIVRKDLDAVRVVQQTQDGDHVLVNVGDGFAAHSFFKLSQLLPASQVSRQRLLFDDAWIPGSVLKSALTNVRRKRDLF